MKNIVVVTEYQGTRTRVETFEEAYEIMKKWYITNEFLYEDEWEEEYPQEELTIEFETDGCIEFCDGDCIITLEKYIERFVD